MVSLSHMSPALAGPHKMCQKACFPEMTKSLILVSTPVSCPGHIYVSWSRSRPELCRRVSVCNGRWRQYRCHADAQYQTFLPVPGCPAVALPTLPIASTPSLLPCCHISSVPELTATHSYCRNQPFQNYSYFSNIF